MDRAAFAERIRLQLMSRYRGANVEVDAARFALHVTGSGLDLTLPLAPALRTRVSASPTEMPALIGEYVASVEHQLTPQPAVALSTAAAALVRAQRPLPRAATVASATCCVRRSAPT